MVSHLVSADGLSQRRACRLADLRLLTWQYKPCKQEREGLRQRLRDLAAERRRFGYRRLHVLLRREESRVNLKAVPQAANGRWSMDFQHGIDHALDTFLSPNIPVTSRLEARFRLVGIQPKAHLCTK